jgi:GMC oxidoreductase
MEGGEPSIQSHADVNNTAEATLFWKSDPSLDTPDLQPLQVQVPFYTPETAHFSPPAASWSMLLGVVRPRSRGHLRITGPNPSDPIEIVANTFSDPADMKALIGAVALCREIGNSAAMGPFVKREVMPGNLAGRALEGFVRDAVVANLHQNCTAKMGRDEMSVVDGRGWVLPGSSASVLHERWPSCGVAEKARIGRDLFRSEDDPLAPKPATHCSLCSGLSAPREGGSVAARHCPKKSVPFFVSILGWCE